jgi:hypothetical protein
VVGIALASLLPGLFVILNPSAFTAIFIVNGWLLGYHHVTSTYTRLVFDRDSLTENRFLLTWQEMGKIEVFHILSSNRRRRGKLPPVIFSLEA